MSTGATTSSFRKDVIIYVSGACLANVPLWVLLLFSSFVNLDSLAFTFLGYFTIFASASFAGLMVASKLRRDYVKVGVVTGLVSYAVHVVSIMVLFGGISVILLFTEEVGDLLILIDFAGGGVLGSIIEQKMREPQRGSSILR
jgi:hypothetical protein